MHIKIFEYIYIYIYIYTYRERDIAIDIDIEIARRCTTLSIFHQARARARGDRNPCSPVSRRENTAVSRRKIIGIFRCPLFRGPPHYKLTCPYLALFSDICI